MPNGEPDTALVQRARLGQRDAYGDLVLRHRRAVLAIAYRMTGDAAAADDIAQTVFLRAWVQLPALHDAGAFRGWLCRLAANASVDHLRRNPATSALPDAAATGAGPEAEALAQEQARAVRQAVLSLPAQCRAALILREFEGLSYREIAEALGIPLGTVMSRLNYARKLLRVVLGAHYAPEPAAEER